jgi:hypothetical protein
LENINVHSFGSKAIKNPYLPAAKDWPSIFTSVENSIVVFSLEPALHGAAFELPNPWSV